MSALKSFTQTLSVNKYSSGSHPQNHRELLTSFSCSTAPYSAISYHLSHVFVMLSQGAEACSTYGENMLQQAWTMWVCNTCTVTYTHTNCPFDNSICLSSLYQNIWAASYCNAWNKIFSLRSAECAGNWMPKHSDYTEPCGIVASGNPECIGTSIYNEACCAWKYQNNSGRNSVAMGMCYVFVRTSETINHFTL